MLLQPLVNATPMFRQFTNHRWMSTECSGPEFADAESFAARQNSVGQAPQWVRRIEPRRLWRAMHRHRQTMVRAKGCARCRGGVEAIAQSRMDEALQDFRRSYAFQGELDPATRQQLYEHLKILGETVEGVQTPDAGLPDNSAVEVQPTAPIASLSAPTDSVKGSTKQAAAVIPVIGAPPTAMELPSVSSAALTRQVAAEVTRQQSLARRHARKAAQAGAAIAATDAQYGGFCFGNGPAST